MADAHLPDFIENNRQVWEEWTPLHLETESDYQEEIQAFESGSSTLSDIDLCEVGNVQGKTLLHLMCHLGLDTLSWARQGALVTGIDFSEASIAAAKELASRHAIPAEFICCDVYHLPDEFACQFDFVYTEGGVLTWLPDLPAYARAVARCLKPGGIYYIRDSHPFRRVIFPVVEGSDGQRACYNYFSAEPTCITMQGSYARPTVGKQRQVFFWVHGLGEIITTLCNAGLCIEFVHEFPKRYERLPTVLRTITGEIKGQIFHGWEIPSTFSLRASLI
jgi:SAM-dependent methyltransferase